MGRGSFDGDGEFCLLHTGTLILLNYSCFLSNIIVKINVILCYRCCDGFGKSQQ